MAEFESLRMRYEIYNLSSIANYYVNHYWMRELEGLMLLALKPLVEISDKVHHESKTNGSSVEDSGRLIDSACILSQAIYKTNIIRVCTKMSINRHEYELL